MKCGMECTCNHHNTLLKLTASLFLVKYSTPMPPTGNDGMMALRSFAIVIYDQNVKEGERREYAIAIAITDLQIMFIRHYSLTRYIYITGIK